MFFWMQGFFSQQVELVSRGSVSAPYRPLLLPWRGEVMRLRDRGPDPVGPLACGHRGARRCPRGCWHRTEACLVVEVIPGACGARTPRGPGRQLLRFKGGVDMLWPAPPPLGPLRERRTLPPRRSHRGEPEARSPQRAGPASSQPRRRLSCRRSRPPPRPFPAVPVPRPSTGHPCRHYHGMSLRRTGTC